MKGALKFLGVAVFLFGLVDATWGTPKYYTYEGTVTRFAISSGGSSTYFTDQGIDIGSGITFVILIDSDRPGERTLNDGTVQYPSKPASFYADYVAGTEINAIGGGCHHDPTDVAELNYGWIGPRPGDMYASNIYVGTGDVFVHFGEYTPADTPIHEWEEGAAMDAGVGVYDSEGEGATAYSIGSFSRITQFTLEMDASLNGGTLSLDFLLETPVPAVWGTYLIVFSHTPIAVPLWQVPLPQITPAVDIPIDFACPSLGLVLMYTCLYDWDGVQIKDFDWVDTDPPTCTPALQTCQDNGDCPAGKSCLDTSEDFKVCVVAGEGCQDEMCGDPGQVPLGTCPIVPTCCSGSCQFIEIYGAYDGEYCY